MFESFMKLSQFFWRWRWWLVILSGLLLFLIMNSAQIPIDSGTVKEADQQVRLNFAIFFALLAAQLVAWLIGVLHALIWHKVRWFIGMLALPPVAFIYLFLKN